MDAQSTASIRDRRDRDQYLEVGECTRQAIERAMAMEHVSAGDLKVLLAITHLLTTRSRVWDFTSHRQLAKLAGISRRAVINSVARFTESEVIKWKPGSPGRMSILRLPSASSSSLSATDIVNDRASHSEETAPHIVKRKLHTSEGFPSYPSEEHSEETPSPPKPLEKCTHGKGALACIQCATQKRSDEKTMAI